MSTAILISGQMRTFAQCFKNQFWHVYRRFEDRHFFITVQDDLAARNAHQHLMEMFGADRVHVQFLTDPDLTADITPQLTAAFDLAPYANAAPAHQLLIQHWYQSEVWKHFTVESERLKVESPGTDFHTIIRIRPDQFFHSFDLPVYQLSTFNFQPAPREAWTPWWGRFGGVNDRLAILGRDAARAYFTVYEQIPALLAQGCPFHPESLVKAALLEAGCTLRETLKTEFTTLRLDGNHRPPEIMPWDIAHAALRAA